MNQVNGQYGNGSVVKLSRRLAALSEWVPEGARFADIGTDHALLPVYLAGSGKVRFAVAGDLHAGPVEAARRQVAAAGLADRVSVRQGDGLSVLEPGEVDTVCIAGMGGGLMVRLLSAAAMEQRLTGVHTLVLSPHVAEDAVRLWLKDNGFILEQERLLEDEGVIYTLLKAVRATDPQEATQRNAWLYDEQLLAPCRASVPVSLLLEMGPLLIRQGGAVFRRKWEQEMAKRERIARQIGQSSAPDRDEKRQYWESAVSEIREVLACLPEEKPSFN
jgi:tRNA (adenine22-N1)-methyltransferase